MLFRGGERSLEHRFSVCYGVVPLSHMCGCVGYIVRILVWPFNSVVFLLTKTNNTILLIILFSHFHVNFFSFVI